MTVRILEYVVLFLLILAEAKRITIPLERIPPLAPESVVELSHTRRELLLKSARSRREETFDVKVSAANDDVTISLGNLQDVLYSITVKIGTPSQSFRVQVDTGSSDLWVLATPFDFSTSKQNGGFADTRSNNFYDSTKSSTVAQTNTVQEVDYGLGAAKGLVANDTVKLSTLTSLNQGFIEAQSVSEFDLSEEGFRIDGILGLAFQHLSVNNFPTVIDSLAADNIISEKMFSLKLTSDGSSGSQMIIGEPDEKLAANGLAFADVLPASAFINGEADDEFAFWGVNIDNFLVAGKNVDICKSADGPCVGIVDSGTTNIGVPSSQFDALAKEILALRSDCFVCDPHCGATNFEAQTTEIACNSRTLKGFPTLNITLGGQAFELRPERYVNINEFLIDSDFLQFVGPFYSPRFFEIDDDFWILGDPFMRDVYSVFDATDPTSPRIGFAQAPPEKSRLSLAELIGVIIGIAGGAFLLFSICYCLYTRFKRRQQAHRLSQVNEQFLPG